MQLKILKTFRKDWTIKDNQVVLLGDYKEKFEKGKETPLLLAGHRIYSFLGLNKFVPNAITQMEMMKLVKKINSPDSEINMQTGQIAEEAIVDKLNDIYSSNGKTFPYTEENKGNVFYTTISNMFSALPDYMTSAKHKVFLDRKLKTKKIHEIKSTANSLWAKDEYQNIILSVVDNSLTEDNIVDNPNKDAIKLIYNSLSKEEKAKFTKAEKEEIEYYIKEQDAKKISKKFIVSQLTRFGIQKWMVEGDLEHNLKPILKNTESIKVKPKVKKEDYATTRWKKGNEWFPPEEYILQVSLYSFLYNMDHEKIIHPQNVKGIYKTEIDVCFLDDDQMVIPKNSWFNKFNYVYKNPKEIKLKEGENFHRINLEIDLHKFYKAVIAPCISIWKETINEQKTQDLDFISWAILKKAFRENHLDVDHFQNIKKIKDSQQTHLIKKTVKEYTTVKADEIKDKKIRQNLVDIFTKATSNSQETPKAEKKPDQDVKLK